MNKTKDQIKLMVENALVTALEEHRIQIGVEHLEHIAVELLSENVEKFLRSVFGAFTLSDVLYLIALVEERKLEAKKKIPAEKLKTTVARPKPKTTDAH